MRGTEEEAAPTASDGTTARHAQAAPSGIASPLAGRRHHLGRRRLARRERGRQRIAARRAPRPPRGPTRAAPRVLLEAAQDHALDRRIEVGDQLGRARRRLLAVLPRAARRGPRRRTPAAR